MVPDIVLITSPVSRQRLREIAEQRFGDMVKAVVDIKQKTMAVGGELHSDEEAFLLDQGSQQTDLWGINLYPDLPMPDMVEFDSMINIRPSQQNESRTVESEETQTKILTIVRQMITDSDQSDAAAA